MKGKVDKLFINDRDCFVYTPYSYKKNMNKYYPVIYCNDGDIMMKCFDKIVDNIEKFSNKNEDNECIIVMVPPLNRNKEYTPWKSQNPFNKETFYGNADEYIDFLINCVMKKINELYRTKVIREFNYILGYSLGGLVSLYTMYKTDVFMKAACISSSLWYEDWGEFIKENKLVNKNSQIFLYLGKNESKSRNKVLKTVLQRTNENFKILETQIGNKVSLLMNEGGHFDNIEKRYIEAIRTLQNNNKL